MGNRLSRFASLGICQGEIGLNSVVAGLDLLCRFELFRSLQGSAQLHQHRAEGFVSFGNLRLETYDLSKSRPRQFQVSGLACRVPFVEGRVSPLDGVGGVLFFSLRCCADGDAKDYA